MCTTKQESVINEEADAALKQFFRDALRDPEVLGVLKQALKEAVVEGLKTGVLMAQCSNGNVNGGKVKVNTPVLRPQQGNNGKAKGLMPKVVESLTQAGITSDLIRYFEALPAYTSILNNPYSGDLGDAPRLARGFMNKPGFDERFAQWLRRHRSPATPAAPQREHVEGCLGAFCMADREIGPLNCTCWCHKPTPDPSDNGDLLPTYDETDVAVAASKAFEVVED